MKKKALRWLIYLVAGLIVLVIAFVLLIDPIAKSIAVRRVEAETGMKTEIGKFNVGLRSTTIHIRDFTLRNPPEFGGGIFVEIPELFFEYDRLALSEGRLHLNLVRININEIHIVENKAGEKNTDRLQKHQSPRIDFPNEKIARTTRSPAAPTNSAPSLPSTNSTDAIATSQSPPIRQTNSAVSPALPRPASRIEPAKPIAEPIEPEFVFDGVDFLDVTLRTVKFTSLRKPDQNIAHDLGIRNETFRNLKTERDFETAAALIAIKAGVSFLLSGDLSTSGILLRQSSRMGKESKNVLEELAEPIRPVEKSTKP